MTVAAVAALAVATPAITPPGTPFSVTAEAAALSINDISVTNMELYNFNLSKKFDPQQSPQVQRGYYNVAFSVTVPHTAKKGDTFSLWVAAPDDNGSPDPAGQAKGAESKTTIVDKRKKPIVSYTQRPLDMKGRVDFILERDASDLTNDTFHVTMPFRYNWHWNDADRIGKIGVYESEGPSKPMTYSGITLVNPAEAPDYDTHISIHDYVSSDKGFSEPLIGILSHANTEPHSTYIQIIPKDLTKYRAYYEKNKSGRCTFVQIQNRINGYATDEQKRTITGEAQQICTKNGIEILVNNLKPHEALYTRNDLIGPYTGSTDTSEVEIRIRDGQPNATIEQMRATDWSKASNNQNDLAEPNGFAQVYTIYPQTIPGLAPAAHDYILDGPVQSSLKTIVYDAQTATKGANSYSVAVAPKETQNQDFENPGNTWTPTEDTPSWTSINPKTGVITMIIDKDTPVGEHDVRYLLTWYDGSTQIVHEKITVKARPLTETNNPRYRGGITATQGGNAVTLAKPSGITDKKATFALDKGTPGFITIAKDGAITARPGWDDREGTTHVGVTVTYSDGTKDTLVVPVSVNRGNQSDRFTPRYGSKVVTVTQGKTGTVAKPSGIPADASAKASATTPPWAHVNPDGSITVTPGADVSPGKYTIPVVVVYADGTSDTVTVPVKVTAGKKADLDDRDVRAITGAPERLSVAQGKKATATLTPDEAVTLSIKGNPSWVTLKGKTLTAKPGLKQATGDTTITIVGTYSDGSTVESPVTITVTSGDQSAMYNPSYNNAKPVHVNQARTASIPAPSGVPNDAVISATAKTPEWVTVGSNGVITLAPTMDTPTGDVTIPVKVTYADGTMDIITAKAVVDKASQADKVKATLGGIPLPGIITVTQGDSLDVPLPDIEGDPDITLTPNPDWVTITDEGVRLAPTLDTPPGSTAIEVTATFDDGSTLSARTTAVVNKTGDNKLYSPSWPAAVTLKQNDVIAIPAPAKPDTATFTPEGVVPAWIVVDTDGGLDVAPTFDTLAALYTVSGTITYADGSTDRVTTAITVERVSDADRYNGAGSTNTPWDNPDAGKPIDPNNPDAGTIPAHPHVAPGSTVTIPAPDLGKGATCTAESDIPDWITVNSDCSITAKPGKDVKPGDYTGTVTVTYPDGSTVTKELTVTVDKVAMDTLYPVNYPEKPVMVTVGDTTTVPAPTGLEGSQATCTGGEQAPAWATVNSDCSITLNPGDDVAPGEYTVPIVVTYPDGTIVHREVKVTVGEKPKTPDNGLSSGEGTLNINNTDGSSAFAPVALILGVLGIVATLVNSLAHAKLPGLPPLPQIPGLPNLLPPAPAPAPAPCPDPRDHVAVDNVNREKLEHNDHNLCVKTDTTAVPATQVEQF